MGFVKVEEIEQAQYWIPTYDERFVGTYHTSKLTNMYRKAMEKLFNKSFEGDSRVIYNKPYKLFFNNFEPIIIDELGCKGVLWLCHKGYFVKEL